MDDEHARVKMKEVSDHQRPVGLRHLVKDPNLPTPDHIHTVVRTPNGNDYGKDLLRLHYLQHPHAH